MTDKIIVFTTCASEPEAERLARTLVEQHLAACVNVLPNVRSYYQWKGALESALEILLVIKSSRNHFDALRAAIEKTHSYEVPEIIAMPIVDGSANYLNWLESGLRSET